jgi:hypothetical protein
MEVMHSLMLSIHIIIHIVSKRRRQKEAREERADLELLGGQNRDWEEAEAAADEYEYQQILKEVEIESQRMAEANKQWALATRTRVKNYIYDQSIPQEYSPMEEKEAAQLRETERLDRKIKKQKTELKHLQRLNQRYAPYGHLLPRSHDHRRRSGKVLTDDERRAVLHCFGMCQQEHLQRIVSTVAPIQRTAHYLGMSTKTVKEVLKGIKTRDKRGRYIRTLRSKDFEPYILNLTKEWNLEGTPVTLKKIRKSLRENWGGTYLIPSFEALRRQLHRMGLRYNRTDKAKNYVDTPDIILKRRHYLRERYSDKYAGALFVWLDESYIHHHHVHNKVQAIGSKGSTVPSCIVFISFSFLFHPIQSWFSHKMTVLRKNKGRRWCIIYAGSEEGWMGTPWVWEADNRSADYHENMNANMFEQYMTALCDWCKTHYPGRKIVFCMDNAKYHRREHQNWRPVDKAAGTEELIRTVEDYLRLKVNRGKGKGKGKGKVTKKVENEAPQKSLSQMNKEELVLRLSPILSVLYAPVKEDEFATKLRLWKKSELYALARKPEFALPLTTEVIAQK